MQLPEETDGKSEAYKIGYKTVCDIGEEHIRRVGKKIKEKIGAGINCSFCYFKIDSFNMEGVYYRPTELRQASLDGYTDSIKEDRTPEDLLIQVMLDLEVLLSSRMEQTGIGGKKVPSVTDGYLTSCFNKDVTGDVVAEIARRYPPYFVSHGNSMASDSVTTNFEKIFKAYSPETVRKVL